jgi:uncharacterized protein (DUF433 family)
MSTAADQITRTPGVCGGRACVAGHRVRVMDIAIRHEMGGCSPDEIVDLFPGITLPDVFAALAYYFAHREEIEADIRHDEQLDRAARNAPSKLKGQRSG